MAADPDPSGVTGLMTPDEASAITADPVGHTWLDICRARRTGLTGYLESWSRMTDGQRVAASAMAAATPPESVEACAARFRDANDARRRREAVAAANLRQALTASEQPEPEPVAQHRIASASECQWWRDEIERDDHEAYVATTRDLREAWDHNRMGAQNGYREACQ